MAKALNIMLSYAHLADISTLNLVYTQTEPRKPNQNPYTDPYHTRIRQLSP